MLHAFSCPQYLQVRTTKSAILNQFTKWSNLIQGERRNLVASHMRNVCNAHAKTPCPYETYEWCNR